MRGAASADARGQRGAVRDATDLHSEGSARTAGCAARRTAAHSGATRAKVRFHVGAAERRCLAHGRPAGSAAAPPFGRPRAAGPKGARHISANDALGACPLRKAGSREPFAFPVRRFRSNDGLMTC